MITSLLPNILKFLITFNALAELQQFSDDQNWLTPVRQSGPGYITRHNHCVKSVQIWSFSGPYFPELGFNTEIYAIYVFSPNTGKYGPEKPRI